MERKRKKKKGQVCGCLVDREINQGSISIHYSKYSLLFFMFHFFDIILRRAWKVSINVWLYAIHFFLFLKKKY